MSAGKIPMRAYAALIRLDRLASGKSMIATRKGVAGIESANQTRV